MIKTTFINNNTFSGCSYYKDELQYFHPSSLCVIQPLFKSTHNDLIDNLSLSIPLWIRRGGISICYAQVTTIPLKGLTIELKIVIRDEGTRDSKPSDNIFPNKSLGIHIPDICQWFSFNPFNEVICADQQIPLISYCLREKTYNVQAPLSKRPRVGQRVKDSSWLMNVWCKSLALVTLLHMLLCFPLHIWPPIALGKGLVRQRFASCVAPTNSFM